MGCGTSKCAQVTESSITTTTGPSTSLSETNPSSIPDNSREEVEKGENSSQKPTSPVKKSTSSTKPSSPVKPESPTKKPTSPLKNLASPVTSPSPPAVSPGINLIHPTPEEKELISSLPEIHPCSDPVSKQESVHGSLGENATMETTGMERSHPVIAGGVSSDSDKYASFEIDMGHKGSTSPSGPPPKRLEKMAGPHRDSADVLAEKQRVVQERKDKELEKRANPRLSRKERLLREILESRKNGELGEGDEIEANSSEESNHIIHSKPSQVEDEFENRNYTEGPMEVDQTYNAEGEPGDIWDGGAPGPQSNQQSYSDSIGDNQQDSDKQNSKNTPFGDWGSIDTL